MQDFVPVTTIVVRAQHSVNQWQAGRLALDFAGAMDAAIRSYWPLGPAHAAERDAFLQVAQAIQRGEGQVTRTPAPLLRIARTVLEA